MMPASLSPAQVVEYRRDGFLFPIDCLTQEEVLHYRGRLEAFEREQGDTFGNSPISFGRSRIYCSVGWTNWCAIPKFWTRSKV